MEIFIFGIILLCYVCFMDWFVWRTNSEIRRSWQFLWAGFVGYIILSAFFYVAAGQQPVMAVVCAFFGLLFSPYLMFAYVELIYKGKKVLMSEDQIRVEPTFDQTDALIKKRKYPEAEAMLRRELEQLPEEAGLYNRLSELYVSQNRSKDALSVLLEGLKHVKEPGKRSVLYLRAGEISAEELGDTPGAIRLLKKMRAENLGERPNRLANERLNLLKKAFD